MIGKLQPIEIEEIEISNVSWTKENSNTANSPVAVKSMPPESSFQPEQNNSKQLILLQNAQILQEAKEMLFLFLKETTIALYQKYPWM